MAAKVIPIARGPKASTPSLLTLSILIPKTPLVFWEGMFSSTVRRAAFTPQNPIAASFICTAPRTATSQALTYRGHQRRFSSSSKPSSPADGSKGVARGQEVPSKPASPADTSKSVAQAQEEPAPSKARPDSEKKSLRASKRRAKDGALWNLPSVPSTQHIPPGQITASSFFSLHRPISLHISFPKTVTDDAFAAIFTPRTRANLKPSEVISTLSNTLDNLDSATGAIKQVGGSQQEQWNTETDELRAAITAESYRKQETQHLDSHPADSAMNFSRQIMSGRYQPFSPPPAPVPMNTAESLAAGAEASEMLEPHKPQHRTYTAVLTIEESTDEHGEVTYMAHSSPLVQKDPPTIPTRFLERMYIRRERHQERSRERANQNRMEAISVKRQRKLKMKKHKYKKLMRRTRNLRRRLDRN